MPVEKLYDQEIMPKNLAGNEEIEELALNHVLSVYDKYKKMRVYTQGGRQIDIVKKWDEKYRLYKTIRNNADHSYEGVAQVFVPVARRAVNIIESETSNALFSRDDYFQTETVGDKIENQEEAQKAHKVLKYYSEEEKYIEQFELCAKQALIYGVTAGEVIFKKEQFKQKVKKRVEVPVLDEKTGEPMLIKMPDGTMIPMKNTMSVVEDQEYVVERPRIEARDIYRLHLNHISDNPLDEDIVYRDCMSAQKLLTLAEQGVYNKEAVNEIVSYAATFGEQTNDTEESGTDGKPFLSEPEELDPENVNQKYEVLRFQGKFSPKESDTLGVQEEYWIDIGERREVLRIILNPLYGKKKTFVLCNYDTMYGEFYTDSIIDPIKSIQYEMNDKENQSLDALTFGLNAPYLRLRSANIKTSQIEASRKTPNAIIDTQIPDGLKKLSDFVNVTHLNMDLSRLNALAEATTGATSLAGGAPTGTQVDRSGKSLAILQSQTKSQFSKFIRKFERNFIEESLSKCWMLIQQFSNDVVPMEIVRKNVSSEGEQTEGLIFMNQNVSEIVAQIRIRVKAGSEYIKDREMRDSILEFLSIAGMNDAFMAAIDVPKMLKAIARTSLYDMSEFVNPQNLYSKQQQMIQQLNTMLGVTTVQNKKFYDEMNRLADELKQTDRSNMVSKPISDEPAVSEAKQGK